MVDKTVIAAAIVTLGSLIVAYLTKRSAKDNTVVTGFTELTERYREEVNRLGLRITALEHVEGERRRLARQHEVWDWAVVKRLRAVTDEPIPDPPPLDVWE